MHEVCEQGKQIVLLLGLSYLAWMDIRTNLIEINGLIFLGIAALLGMVCGADIRLVQYALGGALVGVGVLICSRLSGECIGEGDGWLFVVTGFYLGALQNLTLLFGSVFFAGIFAIACLVLKKKGKEDRIALVPFVLTAYVVFIL